MPLDDLPPDLRATLSLLVDRGKSYAEVAQLLGMSEDAVRDRAHTALDRLAGVPGDFVGPPTAWAASPAFPSQAPPPSPTSSPFAPAQSSPAPTPPATTPSLPVSRRGGAVLLSAILVVIVVAVVLLTSGGSGDSSNHAATSTVATSGSGTTSSGASGAGTAGSTTSTGGSSTSGSKATVTNQSTLTATEPGSNAIGIAEVLAEGSQHAIFLAAEHLPATHGFVYVLWLYNSPTSAQAIGKTTVDSSGRVQAASLLPSNAGDYHRLLLTRETGEHPTTPGPAVLSGSFSLG